MKSFILVSIVFASLLLTACLHSKTHTVITDSTANLKGIAKADTFTYNYKTIREQANNGTDKKCIDCSYAEISYPVFDKMPILNDSITHRILNYNGVEAAFKNAKDVHAIATNFIKFYEKEKKNDPKVEEPFTLDMRVKVLTQAAGLIVLEIREESNTGGVHGSEWSDFVNWSTNAAKPLYLKDILINGYEAKLTKIGEKIFRKNEQLSDTASLELSYFFKNDIFVLNNNFFITPKGIAFYYNNYEIKSYAAGPTTLLIPYTAIKQLLRPNTVITQYIK